ncbi:MAG: mercury(II) reductase [Gammaproteobacteria bacterium]|nr:MAG: mercury(II) reductase [Gammaproteobacteria bacterium]
MSGCCSQGPGILVIGSGGAATAAALKAASRGAKVTVVERGTLGGTCVNVGCVPSKVMINAAHVVHVRRQSPFDGGISASQPNVDRKALVNQQQALVENLRQAKYADVLARHDNIRVEQAEAQFEDGQHIRLTFPDGRVETRVFDKCFIGTGARSAIPPIPGLQDSPFITSTEALVLEQIPPRLIVLGASVVAVELAQAFARLGSRVTILARSRVLSRWSKEISQALTDALKAEGIEVLDEAGVSEVAHDGRCFHVQTRAGVKTAEQLLVATGRTPNTEALNLAAAGIETQDRAIRVDAHLRTTHENVFAAGDCTTLPQFVYVAAAAGSRAGENMTGGDATLDLSVVPEVIFTDPQAARVGLSDAEAREQGIETDVRTLDLAHVPRAIANFDTRGLIRMVAERTTGRLLGVQMLAHNAGDVIQSAALAIRAGMTVQALSGELFPYLTMAEGLKLCAQTFSQDVAALSCCAG